MIDPSRYATRCAPTGMVVSVDHLASEAGVAMLRAGGSAADAAVAASAVVAVTTPHMCGMGGDLWALVHHGAARPPDALNASGRAGSGADPVRLRAEGHRRMPFSGDIRSVPVPGCVDGWLALHRRHGRLRLDEVLGPAVNYAAQGFPAGPLLAALVPLLDGVAGMDDLVRDPPLRPGQRVTRLGVARALEAVAAQGRDGFYLGEFGQGLLELGGGEYAEDDLRRDQSTWVEPLSVEAWNHDVWALPPNSQGYVVLAAAAMASGLDLPPYRDPLRPHLLVEAVKQASFDRPDRLHEGADGAALLDPATLDTRRRAIDPETARAVPAPSATGDTIYLAAVDGDGMGVSLIQSNASAFGVGLAVGRTGIMLHNRGIGFSLAEGHPAAYGPGRRPPSTLTPVVVTRPDGSLRAVLGTMGGDAQPAIVLQLLVRLLHDERPAGPVVASPRWVLAREHSGGFDTWTSAERLVVQLERDAPTEWVDGLRARGHEVVVVDPLNTAMGHAHCIEQGELLAGAADPRALIGAAAGY